MILEILHYFLNITIWPHFISQGAVKAYITANFNTIVINVFLKNLFFIFPHFIGQAEVWQRIHKNGQNLKQEVIKCLKWDSKFLSFKVLISSFNSINFRKEKHID